MRLIGKLNSEELSKRFCAFLKQEGIISEYGITTVQDFGNDSYGESVCNIWIVNEDHIEQAKKEFQTFLQDPENNRFQVKTALETPSLFSSTPSVSASQAYSSSEESSSKPTYQQTPHWAPNNPSPPQKIKPVTLYILMACVWIFIWSWMSAPDIDQEKIPKNLPFLPFYVSSIYKTLAYDYPRSNEIVDELIEKYGVEALGQKQMPTGAYPLIQEYNQSPSWNGLYPYLISFLKNEPLPQKAPLFEKIGQNEYWRSVTPIFLHGNLIHLLFNGMWILVLGIQIEERIKVLRYLLLIVISAIISNTAQYLVSGPNFIGISGVVCALLAFIWVREKKAPWEGYRIPSSTFKMVLLFVLGMVVLQTISFVSDIYFNSAFNPGIANTAHLAGGLTGYMMAKVPLFRKRA